MSLQFAKMESVNFGGLEATISMTAEQKLRVRTLDIQPNATEADLDEARSILATCFGEKSGEVLAFMKANMSGVDLQRLRIYLSDGPQVLKLYEDNVVSLLLKNTDEALREQKRLQSNG